MRKQAPTLFLTHVQFYEDCTVGRLNDKDGQLICMTLEPSWHGQERGKRKKTSCIGMGVYSVTYGYDTDLKYQCWLLSGKTLKTRVRLCFLTKDGSTAAQTRRDILLGYLSPEGDAERPFEGRLYRPAEAFGRLLAYYAALRANHGDFCLKVEPVDEPVTLRPAVEAPDLSSPLVQPEDYLLQTL